MSKRIPFKRTMKSSVEKHGGQAVADEINYCHNNGQLNDEQFKKYMTELYDYLPAAWKHNIDVRRDGRTPGQMFLDLKNGIKIENLLFRAFVKEVWVPIHNLPEEYTKFRSNAGRPWLDKKLVEKTADYTLKLLDREVPVDVKFIKNPNICTPKEDDLLFCIKKNIYMLLFWNGGEVDGDKKTFDRSITKFALFGPKAMTLMWTEVEPCYPKFYHGMKAARQVFKNKNPCFDRYFEQHDWDTKSITIPE